MQQTITIAGRNFHGVTQELSAAQDDYLMGQLRLAGALDLFIAPAVQKVGKNIPNSIPPEELAESLLTQILVSGRASHILAGCLTEQEKKWTVEQADRNAEAFAAITGSADKQAMRAALVEFVIGFFRYATASVATSRNSSSRS
jgi:hypothetical protein